MYVLLGDQHENRMVSAFLEVVPSTIVLADTAAGMRLSAGQTESVNFVVPSSLDSLKELAEVSLLFQNVAKKDFGLCLDRAKQHRALAANASAKTCSSAKALAAALVEAGGELVVKSRYFAEASSDYRCRSPSDAEDAFRIAGGASEQVIALPLPPEEQRYSIEAVSLEGRHFIAAVFSSRVDVIDGRLVVRDKISVLKSSPLGLKLIALATSALGTIGHWDGVGTVRIARRNGVLQVEEILAVGDELSPSVDAWFRAFGFTLESVAAERFCNPKQLGRRLEQRVSSPNTLAVVPLRLRHDKTIEGYNGVELIRRLPGYHSMTHLPKAGQTFPESAAAGFVNFVHHDRAQVESAVEIIHELEDSGALFKEREEFFAYSAY